MSKTNFSPNIDFGAIRISMLEGGCQSDKLVTVSLFDVLLSHKWKKEVEQVRASTGEERKNIKRQLPAFYPSGVFRGKEAKDLVQHSGFICIDIDGKDNEGAQDFSRLKDLVRSVPYVAYCGLSVSGTGYFCLIPIADSRKHKEYFRALAEAFRACGIQVDRACSNVNRLRFVSYDAAPYINTGAIPYDTVLPISPREQNRQSLSSDEAKKIEALISDIKKRQVDITGDYKQWFEILSALASTFGEAGREYAHEISSMYNGYSPSETDRQYSECLKHGYDYSIATVYHYAKNELSKHDFDNVEIKIGGLII